MLESTIEKAVCDGLKALEFVHIKLGFDGWMDRLVLSPTGFPFFIEFKAPNGPLRPDQLLRIRDLHRHHVAVLVIDKRSDGEDLLAELRQEQETFHGFASYSNVVIGFAAGHAPTQRALQLSRASGPDVGRADKMRSPAASRPRKNRHHADSSR